MDQQQHDTIYERMITMLDRIHLQIENDVVAIETMFDEIGCLIAEARGEYNPNGEQHDQ